MTNPARFSLSALLVPAALTAALFAAGAKPAAAQAPANPPAGSGSCVVPPGKWDGNFRIHITGAGTSNKLSIQDEVYFTGDAAFNVTCDGKVSGTFANVELDVTSRFSPDPAGIGFAGCDMPIAMTLNSGSVAIGKDGQPAFTLNWTSKNGAPDCGSAYQKSTDIMTSAMAAAGGAGDADTWIWQDIYYSYEGPNPGHVSGTDPFGSMNHPLIYVIPAQFSPDLNYYFKLNEPMSQTPTATLQGSYRDVFLAGLGPVNDVFTANINWAGGTPGTVSVDLDGKTYPASVNGNLAKTDPIDVSALKPGTYPVLATAKSPGGQIATASMTLSILAVPVWAKDFALAKDGEGPCVAGSSDDRLCVFYAGSHDLKWPVGTAIPNLSLPGWIPIFGGQWGFQPLTLAMKVAPRSDILPHSFSDHRGEAPVSGSGSLSIAGHTLALNVRNDSATRVETTQDAMTFLTGEIGPGVAAPSDARFDDAVDHVWQGQLDLLTVIPDSARQAIYSIPVIGGAIKYVLPNVAEYEAHVMVSGGAALGPGDDGKITVGNGQVVLDTSGYVGVGPNSVIGGAQLRGSINGEFTLGLAPLALKQCKLLFNFYIEASLIGTIPINSTPITACDQQQHAGLDAPVWRGAPFIDGSSRGDGGRVILAAASAPAGNAAPAGSVLAYPTRTGWKPFANVADKVAAGVPSGRAETRLVTNATAFNAAPAIAAGPNGQLAMAFVAEDATQPRPKSFHVVVRLFDGKAWSKVVNLADGTNAQTTPAMAFDGNGHLIVVWTSLKPGANGFAATVTATTFDAADIAGADVDPATGKFTRFALTSDTRPDGEPQVARATDGSLWIGWRSGMAGGGNVFQFKVARWTGTAPKTAETVPVDGYAASWSLAAGDATHVAIAAAIDDGASHRIELLTRTSSTWPAPATLATLTVPSSVAAAFDPQMNAVVAWNDGKGLVGSTAGAAPTAWVTGTAAPLALAIGKDGGLSVVAADGTVVETLARPSTGAWSSPTPLIASFSTQTSVGLATRDSATWFAARAAVAASPTPAANPAGLAANADIILSAPAS